MKLNVGSSDTGGRYRSPEWINIDIVKFGTTNFEIGDPVKGLKYESDFFEEVHCIHVLEHIDRNDHNKFLKELHRVTKPDGVIYVEVPDFIRICSNIIELNKRIAENWEGINAEVEERLRCETLSIYGKGRWEGDTHRWGFTAYSLWKTIEDSWFEPKEMIPAGPRNYYHKDKMVSSHYKQEPVILIKAIK